MATDRTGLYCMVALSLLYGCNTSRKVTDVKEKVSTLDSRVQEIQNRPAILQSNPSAPLLQQTNVIGNPVADKFYDLNGQRVYLEIDGRSVESYIPLYPSNIK